MSECFATCELCPEMLPGGGVIKKVPHNGDTNTGLPKYLVLEVAAVRLSMYEHTVCL